MFDYQKTIISQYAQSPTINRLIENMADYIRIDVDMDNFLVNIWDINTANSEGLNIWGKIVGVKRNVRIPTQGAFFGFAKTRSMPFNQAPFFTQMQSEVVSLDDETFRQLIKIKALANISATTAPALNTLLKKIYPDKVCYVIDNNNMTASYVIADNLTPIQFAILTQTGVMPKPAGVFVNIIQIDTANTFGFNHTELQPFNQGIFQDK